MTSARSAKVKYQSLFFVGLALVIVLLPLPNIFGILLDATLLALAYPVIGRRISLLLVFVYNFNPLKLNGALTLYYFLCAAIKRSAILPSLLNGSVALGTAVTGAIILATLLEFLVIGAYSGRVWKFLISYDPRMRSMLDGKL